MTVDPYETVGHSIRPVAYVTQEMWDAKCKRFESADLLMHEVAGNTHIRVENLNLCQRIDKFLTENNPDSKQGE